MVNDDFEGHEDRLDAVIFENKEYGTQVRFTVTEFMDRYYMGIRRYYLSFEGEWLPTKSGFSWPYDLKTSTNLFCAFTELLSNAEVLHEVFKEAEKRNDPDAEIHQEPTE
ncbi:putative ssDNA-binding transcriptionalregulator [Vibrio phage VCPH]|nr:putative ssDNA-binding transcriptionalregulator [Vibrio phage VCPH]